MQTIKQLLDLSPEQLIAAVLAGDVAESQIITLPLDNASTDLFIPWKGMYIGVIQATDLNVSVDIEFNRLGSGKTTFTQGLYVTRPFAGIYLTNTAQPGKSISFIVSPYAPLFKVDDNRSNQLQASYLSTIASNTTNNHADLRSLNGDVGNQIATSAAATGAASSLIYTVPAGKVFYLSTLFASAVLVNTGTTNGSITVLTNTSSLYSYLFYPQTSSGTYSSTAIACMNYSKPLKFPAGYQFYVDSRGSLGCCVGILTGWEENA